MDIVEKTVAKIEAFKKVRTNFRGGEKPGWSILEQFEQQVVVFNGNYRANPFIIPEEATRLEELAHLVADFAHKTDLNIRISRADAIECYKGLSNEDKKSVRGHVCENVCPEVQTNKGKFDTPCWFQDVFGPDGCRGLFVEKIRE